MAAAKDRSVARLIASAAAIDSASGSWLLIDPSPDMASQFARLALAGTLQSRQTFANVSIFLTHIHLGHYWGLGFLGKEGAGVMGTAVHAGARAAAFLRANEPFKRMIEEGRISVRDIESGRPVRAGSAEITPVAVPHRAEYSETFGFLLKGPASSVFYMPDADFMSDGAIEAIERADWSFIDGTFYSRDEIPGLSDGKVPHPPMLDTIEKLAMAAGARRGRIVFTHFNHTNPVLDAGGRQRGFVEEKGFGIAADFMSVML